MTGEEQPKARSGMSARAQPAPILHSAGKERSRRWADDIILFHLLLSIFESTGKRPSCKMRESLISKAVPVSEVPLAGWRWLPRLC